MFPNVRQSARLLRQQGFLIPLAIFILVVMAVLALVVARTANQTNSSFTQELLSVEAFYAAESGAQRAMQVLFFPDSSSRQAVDARCASLATTYTFPGVNGLQLCSTEVSCTCVYKSGANCDSANNANYQLASNPNVSSSFYTVKSSAHCGEDRFLAERLIQAGAYLDQE